jgi:hypothetical protein
MKQNGLLRYITPWSVLAMIAVLALLLAVWGLTLRSLSAATAPRVEPTVIINVIPAPTSTQPSLATLAPTPTPKVEPGSLSTPSANEQIKIGDYVQIAGTGGDGLRIRSGPGTQNPPLFLGMEAEVFQVVDGPKTADNFIWWNLAAPYDENRKGWAASNYLTVIAKKP